MAIRYDSAGELMQPVKTAEGFLLVDAYITRPGVFEYLQADGTVRRELRPREEVYSKEALASFARKPTTLMHPTDDEGKSISVTPENAKRYATGTASEAIWIDEEVDRVRCTLTILDADHIIAIERDGIVEQSCGYSCDIEEVAGEDEEFGPYDVIQRQIRGNHIATVPRGRAGRSVRLRADAAQMLTDDEDDMSTKKARTDEDAQMMGSEEPKVDMAKIDAMLGKVDEYMGKMDAMCSKMDELLALMPAPAAAEGMEEESEMMDRADSEEERLAWFNERQRLLGIATKIDGADKMTNRDLARAIAKTAVADLRADASDEYVNGVISMLVKTSTTKTNTASSLGQQLAETRQDGDTDPRAGFAARFRRAQ